MSFIEFRNISKAYGDCHACRDITFSVSRNSIHALIGENGAGKSTLMKIFGGIDFANSGEMKINGELYFPKSAKDAFRKKIGFIHQHFLLAGNLTVLQHFQLNWPKSKIFSPPPTQAIAAKVQEILQRFGWSLNFEYLVSELSVGEQQRIEIIKALLSDPEIIIFDEPTAVLAPQEVLEFINFLRRLKSEGKTIFLISHKLSEIKAVADAITILRHGESVATRPAAETSIEQMAELMIGKKMQGLAKGEQKSSVNLPLLFSLPLNFSGLSFPIFEGEILGVAGIEGHGQSLLIKNLLAQAHRKQIPTADIAENRLELGIFQDLNLWEHLALRYPSEFSRNSFLQTKKLRAATQELVERWDVRPQNTNLEVGRLSGGNQQKFVVGRELYGQPRFIMAAHPTRGVDLGAQEMIHLALIERTENGAGCVLISSDLDEILKLASRFVILFEKKIFGPFQRGQLSEFQLGQIMTGSSPEQKAHLQGALCES